MNAVHPSIPAYLGVLFVVVTGVLSLGAGPAAADVASQVPSMSAPTTADGNGQPLRLSLSEARALAYQNNLQVLLAHERRQQRGAKSREALSALLPQLSGNVSQSRQTLNLKSQGLSFPGLPTVVGPFNSFDARAQVAQKIFDLSAIRNYQASRVNSDISELQQKLAREQVASGVAVDYVQARSYRKAIVAAKANLDQARSLLQLARNQHKAGLATGVDVARAKTSVAQRRTQLIQARTQSQAADLRLKRATGIALGRTVVLTDHLSGQAHTPPGLQKALTTAFDDREELRIAKLSVNAAEYQKKSALDNFLPTLSIGGNYGWGGATPGSSNETTYSYGVQLDIPLFSGGLNNARMDLAESHRREAKLRMRDLHRQVDEDVRLALNNLKSARQGLKAARATRDLSRKELQLARDRFAKGAADNIEVVNAQTSMADARNQVVKALAVYNSQRVNLAAALGRAQTFHLQ